MLTNAMPLRKMDPSKLIAVPGLADTDVAGAIVWWRLVGNVMGPALAAAWSAAGLDSGDLPEMPTHDAALGRAVAEQKGPRRLALALQGNVSGWALDDVTATDAIAHDLVCKVHHDGASLFTDPPGHPLEPVMQVAFNRYLRELSQTDVSSWLVRLIRKVDAVALRDTGGIYFVPRHQLETWRKVTGAVTTASAHNLFEVPALRTDEAITAVADAVAQEAEAVMAAMQKAVADGDLGARALKTRAGICDAMMSKVASYEQLLGAGMEKLRERIDGMKAELVQAALAAEEK